VLLFDYILISDILCHVKGYTLDNYNDLLAAVAEAISETFDYTSFHNISINVCMYVIQVSSCQCIECLVFCCKKSLLH